MRFPGFQTARNYLANRRTSPRGTPVRTSPTASSNGTSQYYSAQESLSNSQGQRVRPKAPSKVTQLEQEVATLTEQLSEAMFSKRLLRMRCIRIFRKHKMNKEWTTPEKELVEKANKIAHAGDCAFDVLLFDETSDLEDKHSLAIRPVDIEAYQEMYGLKPAEMKNNLDNKALIDVVNMMATISMEKEISEGDIHDFRTQAMSIQNMLLNPAVASDTLRSPDVSLEILELIRQRDTLLEQAKVRYDMKKEQTQRLAKIVEPYNDAVLREVALKQSRRLQKIAGHHATLDELKSPRRTAETQSLMSFETGDEAPVGMTRAFRTPENSRSRGRRSRGGVSVGRTTSKKTAAESPSTEVSPDGNASSKEVLPQTDPLKTHNS